MVVIKAVSDVALYGCLPVMGFVYSFDLYYMFVMIVFNNIFRLFRFSLVSFAFLILGSCMDTNTETYTISPSILHLEVNKDSTHESKVYIKNKSSNKLNITEISSSCGCTVGVLKDSTLLPFDSVSLNIKFTPNKVDSGEVIRFVSLRTTGTPPVISLEIRAKIIPN